MLELVRKAAKTWVAKIFFGVLVASFAVFGIGDVFSYSLGSAVVTVGDEKVSAERFLSTFNREMRVAGQRFGQPVDVTLARQIGLDQQVLSQLAAEAALDDTIDDLSLSVPDETVAQVVLDDPSFRRDGAFDQEIYRYALAQVGYNIETYEEDVRRRLARNQLTTAIVGGATPPAGAAEALFAHQQQERRIDYIVLTAADHAETPDAPDEAALRAFHEENAEMFSAPESRDVVYLHVDIDALAEEFEADEDALRALYQNRAAIYDQPERRALYQIVFDDMAAAQAAHDRIVAGEIDFDGLLAERGETRADTSLGDVTKDEIAPATGEAAFALSAPGVTAPVDTGFGGALIEVAAITPREVVPFEDARAELAADLNREAALNAAPARAGEIEDMRAGGARLEEIAEDAGLPLKRVTLTRDGGDGLAGDPAFVAEAFDAVVDEERDLIETDDGSYFVLRVDAINEATLRPFAEARDEVEAAWRADARRAALEARVEAALARVDDGVLLAVIADEIGVEMRSEGPKTRAAGWLVFGPALIQTLFAEPVGGAAYGAATTAAEAFVIAQVAEIDTPAPDPEALEALKEQLGQMVGSDALQLYLNAKQEEAGVSVNRELLESLLVSGRR